MELMSQYEDNHFDLAVVDPPYGIDMGNKINSITGGVKHKSKDWDKHTPNKEYFDELFRVSKNQIIWGGNYFITKIQKDKSCWIVWDKNNGKSLFADAELAYTSFDKPIRISKVHWCGSSAKHETGMNKIHPTQKPIKLYDWIFQNYANEGDKILDTHLGSGSIAIASHYAGLHLTACEIDEEYFKESIERIKRDTAQETLF
jgi:site-specific DNA-methyltransferase (adenine-specific)